MRLNLKSVEERVRPLGGRASYDREFIFELLAAYGRSSSNITRLRNGSLNVADNPATEVAQRNVVYFKEMAPVEIVASYRTYNMRTSALENLLHRVFAEVRLDVSQVGKDGRRYEPSEWYVVPLEVIDQAVSLIASGDIVDFVYDPRLSRLRALSDGPIGELA